MHDAYEILGLARRLNISETELSDSFREAGKHSHPDAGGEEGEFAELRKAQAVLASPSQRLKHWLELQGLTCNLRGTIDTGLLDLFSEIGGLIQQTEAIIRKRQETKSALGLALLEDETQRYREAVAQMITKVDGLLCETCEVFSVFENATELDNEHASRIARDLTFLEKWRLQLRSEYSRLI